MQAQPHDLPSTDEPDLDTAAPPTPGGWPEWMRLARAAALVVFGLAVHVWIVTPESPSLPPEPLVMPESSVAQATSVGADPSIASEPAAPERRDAPDPVPPLTMQRAVATTGVAEAPVDARRAVRRAEPPLPPRLVRGVPSGADVPPEVGHRVEPAVFVVDASPPVRPAARAARDLPSLSLPLLTLPQAPPRAAAVSAVAAVSVPRDRDDRTSVLQVLQQYETAVERLDARAAKAVWPTVDDRALGRAFSGLAAHSLALEECGVTVAGSEALANCRGIATYLPKVGRRKPVNATHEWTFTLSKAGDAWQIASLDVR